MNRVKVQLARPEPGLEQALKGRTLEGWLPLIGAAVVLVMVLGIAARVALRAAMP